MGYVSFDTLNVSSGQQNQINSGIGFFSLKNDRDEAVVRFMHDSTASFEILATHSIQLNGRFRRVSCVRTPNDPIHTCPLCERGDKLDYRFYIHLLQYTNNPDGSVNVEPKIWERSISYANKLKEYLNNYGPLSDIICKIVRHGRAGDMKTEYEIIPNLNPNVYNPATFKKVDNLFEDYKALGRVVLDKTAQEITEYIQTGDFPQSAQNNQQSKVPETPYNESTGWNQVSEEDNPWSTTNKPEPWNYAKATANDAALPTWTPAPATERPAVPNWAFNEQTTTMIRPTRY